jgi:hypothetical protein
MNIKNHFGIGVNRFHDFSQSLAENLQLKVLLYFRLRSIGQNTIHSVRWWQCNYIIYFGSQNALKVNLVLRRFRFLIKSDLI